MSERAPRASAFERHAQTALTAGVAGLIAWVGVAVTDTNTAVARLEATLAAMKETVARLENQMSDRYTARQAARDRQATEARLNDHEGRIRILENAKR